MKLRSGKVINANEFEKLCSSIATNIYQDKTLTISNDWEGDAEHLLEDADIIFLAEALKKNKYIKELNLSYNSIGDAGAYELSQIERLVSINLAYNGITSTGANKLAQMPNLKQLILTKNYLNEGDVSLLKQSVIHSNIDMFLFGQNNLDINFGKDFKNVDIDIIGEDLE